jgi:hypothetical protein
MLQYMPLYGSILLTIIIVWIIVHTVRSNRRKIGQAVAGTYIRSTCCGATTTPIGWTEEGWTSLCDECGTWQYLGDDHDNPPPGFNADGTPISRVLPAPRPSTVRGPADDRQLVGRSTCTCDTLRYVNGDHLPDCPTQRVAYYDVTAGSEVTSDRYSHCTSRDAARRLSPSASGDRRFVGYTGRPPSCCRRGSVCRYRR